MTNLTKPRPWTPEELETVRTQWSEGRSAKEIAALLRGRSRNCIIGIVYRRGYVRSTGPSLPQPPLTLTEVILSLLRKTETVEFATKAVRRYGENRDYVHKTHLLKVGPIWLNYEKRASYDSDVEIGFITDLDLVELKKPGENRDLYPVHFTQVASFNKADSEKIREQIAKTLLRVGAWEELKL